MALTQDSWRLSSDWQLGRQTKETISNDRHLRTIHSYIFILKPVSQSHIKEWQNRENDWQAHEARMNKHLLVLDHAHKDTHVKFVILNNFKYYGLNIRIRLAFGFTSQGDILSHYHVAFKHSMN